MRILILRSRGYKTAQCFFGLGQTLLPAGDQAARQTGFTYLLVYVTAALGLLLTTSFLGLRRYLRQRHLVMPGAMAFGWMRFGVGLAGVVLIAALLLPRPGATAAWQTLSYQVHYQLHRAGDYAARFGPHGTGPGRMGNEPDNTPPEKSATAPNGAEKTPGPSPEAGNKPAAVDWYRKYLRLTDDSAERARVVGKIRALNQ